MDKPTEAKVSDQPDPDNQLIKAILVRMGQSRRFPGKTSVFSWRYPAGRWYARIEIWTKESSHALMTGKRRIHLLVGRHILRHSAGAVCCTVNANLRITVPLVPNLA